MRSGALPRNVARGTGILDFAPLVADVTGLELERLRECAQEIAHEYSFMTLLRKYNAITLDLRSRLILLEDYMKAFVHRLRGLSSNSNATNKIREIRLCIRNQIINIAYPANLVSVGLLWEIFAEEVYYIEEPVERIYDFGANIGLSAMYFHLLNPSAELICVEPMEENLQLIERNLHSNNIRAELIRVAAGKAEGQATLFFSNQSQALPSLHTKQSQARQVSMLPFDKIVSGNEYGLKIDIEGAEGSLVEFPSIIENAAWIVGELHYSGDIERDSLIDTFFDIVKSNFVVKKSRPIVYFVGDEVLLCESFKASKKL
jgi:FkbM family methyltransferase